MTSTPQLTAGNATTGETPRVQRMEDHPAWPMISRLPVQLAVAIPLANFKVRDLLAIRAGQTIETSWALTEDIPLKVGEVQLGWGEFEVLEQRVALRLTRLT